MPSPGPSPGLPDRRRNDDTADGKRLIAWAPGKPGTRALPRAVTTSHDPPKTYVLLEAAKGGEQKAWESLYNRYHGYLVYIVKMRLVGSPRRGFEAEDVLQEAFLKAWRKLDSFEYRGEGSFLAWLTRIVVNEVLNHQRKRQEAEHGLDTSALRQVVANEELNGTPSEAMMDQESQDSMRKAFEGLCEEDQMLLGLRLGQELTWAEIGEVLGCSRASAAQNFARAIERMRRQAS